MSNQKQTSTPKTNSNQKQKLKPENAVAKSKKKIPTNCKQSTNFKYTLKIIKHY